MYNAIVLSTTHWDRSWYLPFQVSRVRLVRLVDRLIDLLDSTPEFHSFMLDGQMAPVSDYLEIRPERRADLERLIQAGRVGVGPWFVLADEYLVSPEALVRNLQLGLKVAGSFGRIMREGYTPDSFGHIAQLPQILRGFGIESCVFWRGFGEEADALGNEFVWEAPDGSGVLTIHIRDGYHNIANAGYPNRGSDRSAMQFDPDLAQQQVRAAVDLLKPFAQTSQLLLFDGVDHAEANPDILGIMARANATFDDVRLEHNTLEQYIANVRAELGGRPLPVYVGEFNRGRLSHVLQSVYSTRIYLKQSNDRVQRLLEQSAEPINAWAWALGEEYPQALLQEAWRILLLNHPHDDICGCSCDAVHRADVARYAESEQLGQALARDGFRLLMAHINRQEQPGVPFVLFNPAGQARHDTAEITLAFDQNDETTRTFRLVDGAGVPVPFQLLEQYDHFEAQMRKNHYQRRARIALPLDALPAAGYRVLYAQSADTFPTAPPQVTRLPNGMENAFLHVTIKPDGSLLLRDKQTGRVYDDLAHFLDEEDGGDEYDYSHCPQPEHYRTLGEAALIRPIDDGPLQVSWEIAREWSLPQALAPGRERRSRERVTVPITLRVTLRGDNRHLDLTVTVDNRARDHRLRLCFPTDIASDTLTVDGHFDVVHRPIDIPHHPDWVQTPVPTGNQRVFTTVSDGEAGLAIFNRGLPEYEVARDGAPSGGRNTIRVTLLRCIDQLFRDDLLTRPGYTWLPLATPDAQCQGQFVFELAIAPYSGDWSQIYRPAQLWATPLTVQRGDDREGFVPVEAVPRARQEFDMFRETVIVPLEMAGELPGTLSLLTVAPEPVWLSAVKRSEDGELLVIRVVNVGEVAQSADLRLALPVRGAWLLNLNEERQERLPHDGDGLRLAVGAKQVRTVGFEIGRSRSRAPRRVG
jgi:alpha-mannosidase